MPAAIKSQKIYEESMRKQTLTQKRLATLQSNKRAPRQRSKMTNVSLHFLGIYEKYRAFQKLIKSFTLAFPADRLALSFGPDFLRTRDQGKGH